MKSLRMNSAAEIEDDGRAEKHEEVQVSGPGVSSESHKELLYLQVQQLQEKHGDQRPWGRDGFS